MFSKVWDEITYPLSNFKDCTVEVWYFQSTHYNKCNYLSMQMCGWCNIGCPTETHRYLITCEISFFHYLICSVQIPQWWGVKNCSSVEWNLARHGFSMSFGGMSYNAPARTRVWWRHHMEAFSPLLTLCVRVIHRSRVNSHHKGPVMRTLMMFLCWWSA